MARRETLVQLTDELLAALDQHATTTRRSRSDLIREALERYLKDIVEAEIDRQIVEGYTRFPPDEEFDRIAELNTRRSVEEEPW
jgi:metal-responsive CopG/Arc/MetJ family transcriptional regulator